MLSKLAILAACLVFVWPGSCLAQNTSSGCPAKYSDEQVNVIKHSAYIGVAGDYCPNIQRNVKPLLGFMAAAWGVFPSTEFKCDIWKKTYGEAEGQASLQITSQGLKVFCETSIRLYGPGGSLVQGALTFHE